MHTYHINFDAFSYNAVKISWWFNAHLRFPAKMVRRPLRSTRYVLTSFSHILWKIWPQVTRPGQVTQSPKKVCNRVTATVVERKIWKSQDLVYHLLTTSCISRNSYMIDLRSGSQVSQWGKIKYIIHSSANRSEPWSFRLMVTTLGLYLHMWYLERLFKVI